MAAKKINAQQVCDILNENAKHTGFTSAFRARIEVSEDLAINSDVSCLGSNDGFTSSALGFINAIVDDPICMLITNDDKEIPTEHSEGVFFMPLSKTNNQN